MSDLLSLLRCYAIWSNKTQGKHSDSGQSSFKFKNKYASLNNHVRLWTEKDLVGLSMNPRASRNLFFSASALCYLGSQSWNDKVLLLYEVFCNLNILLVLNCLSVTRVTSISTRFHSSEEQQKAWNSYSRCLLCSLSTADLLSGLHYSLGELINTVNGL